MISLQGRAALVTDASGLGLVAAKAVFGAGAATIVQARTLGEAIEAARQVGDGARAMDADVKSREGVTRLRRAILDLPDARVDIVVWKCTEAPWEARDGIAWLAGQFEPHMGAGGRLIVVGTEASSLILDDRRWSGERVAVHRVVLDASARYSPATAAAVADVVLLLASDGAKHLSGTYLPVTMPRNVETLSASVPGGA